MTQHAQEINRIKVFFVGMLLLAALLSFAVPTNAQVTTGTPPLVPTTGGPDIIDLSNLNAHFTIPLLVKKGRGGMDFYYNLNYDTSVWYPSVTGGTGNWLPAFNFGWSAQTAVQVGWLSYKTLTMSCTHSQFTRFYSFAYYDANGTPHPFAGAMEYDPSDCDLGTSTTLNATATDNSGYLLNATISGVVLANHKITNTSGAWTTPPTSFTNGYSGTTTTLTDRNGNEITASSTTSSATYTDTLGTTAVTVAGSGTPVSPVTYSYTGPSGSVQYTMKYTTQTVHTAFGCAAAEYPATAQNLVSEIDLPDGSKYSFTYETTPGDAHTPHWVTGRLQSITLPTGGTITYTYSGGSSGHVNCTDGSASGYTRATPDGTWTYAHTIGTPSTTTVTDPTGNQAAYNFSGLYETQATFNQGASTVLKQNVVCYNNNFSSCGTATVIPPITKRDFYTYLPNLTSPGVSEDYYNSLGLVTDDYEYDYVPIAGGHPYLKHTAITYATLGNNITGFPSNVTVYDNSGTAISSTTYNYDAGSVDTTHTGTPQHVSVTGSRGNLTSINYPAGGLTASYAYYDTGTLKTSTDVNSAVTTFNYSNVTNTCGWTFPTSLSEPLSLSKSMTWNCTGAVQLTAVDENSQPVTAAYTDAYFWRPGSVTDPLTNQTTFYYQPNPTYQTPWAIESTMTFNSSSSVTNDLKYMDSLGRVYTDQRVQAPGSTSFDTTSYVYDSSGRLWKTSGPCTATATASCTSPTTTQTYDAINRPLVTTDAAAGTVTNTYNANDVLVTVGPAPTGENTKRRQLEYDALGRLTSVCELSTGTGSGTCGQSIHQTGYWTTYTYDVLDNLKTVTQNAQAAVGSQQSRSYSYDAMSRLTSETNPESGTTSYSYDVSSPCTSSNGDMIKKIDAIGTRTCIAYDALHRPTTVSNSINSTCKFFLYDSNPGVGWTEGNVKGRLSNAYIGNCSGGAVTGPDQGFNYSARGELLNIYQTTVASGIWYNSAATYWANGALNTLQLFYCTSSCTNTTNNVAVTPLMTYNADGEGRPSTVSASSGQNPVTATTYNVASQPTAITYGSTDTDALTYDPNTFRLNKYQFNVNGQAYSGTVTWNANGSVGKLITVDPFNSPDNQTCTYTHDDLSRVASVNCGASTWQQNFTYDAFGNLTKTVPVGGTGNSFQPTYSTTTNRMTALPGITPTYDADGDLTSDGAHTYTWDAYGNSITMDGVGLSFDASDRMVEQNRSGTLTEVVYAPTGQKFALMNGTTLKKALVPLPGRNTAVYVSAGLDHYQHVDWLRSNRVNSTPARTVQSTYAYAPFSDPYAYTSTTNLSFTGQNQDTSTGNYDFMNRTLNATGRWVSPDPAGLAAVDLGTPQTWNRYAYVAGDPLALIDPFGLFLNGILSDPGPVVWCCDPSPDPDPAAGWGDPQNNGSGGGGGGGGNKPSTPPPAPVKPPACKGKTAADLNYNVPNSKGETGQTHIQTLHMAEVNGNPVPNMKSQYLFSPPMGTSAQNWQLVVQINAFTFNNPTKVSQSSPNSNIVFTSTLPPQPRDPSNLFDGPRPFIGQPRAGTLFGMPIFGPPTNVNTLVTQSDCTSVRSSYPGYPGKSE